MPYSLSSLFLSFFACCELLLSCCGWPSSSLFYLFFFFTRLHFSSRRCRCHSSCHQTGGQAAQADTENSFHHFTSFRDWLLQRVTREWPISLGQRWLTATAAAAAACSSVTSNLCPAFTHCLFCSFFFVYRPTGTCYENSLTQTISFPVFLFFCVSQLALRPSVRPLCSSCSLNYYCLCGPCQYVLTRAPTAESFLSSIVLIEEYHDAVFFLDWLYKSLITRIKIMTSSNLTTCSCTLQLQWMKSVNRITSRHTTPVMKPVAIELKTKIRDPWTLVLLCAARNAKRPLKRRKLNLLFVDDDDVSSSL